MRTQEALFQEGGLRLHKIVSNDSNVMTNFSSEDLVKDLMSLGLTKDALPIQRSLGISWELKSDSVTFRIRPFRTCSSHTYPKQAIVEKEECSNK